MKVQEIYRTECDACHCLAEATHFVFLDLELWNGITVQVRLRLCEQHTRKIEQDYLRGRVSDRGLPATASMTLSR
jgi:hypothetical protein